MFGSDVHCLVVVGAQWGDEGKGKVVDALAEHADVVVRYQGGANAGHTVDTGEGEFVLHQIPSGILHPRCTCVIGNGVVLDAETLFQEMDALTARKLSLAGRLVVSDRAHLVLPYHKLLDAESERSKKIGTTARGIGPAYEDKYGRRGVRVGDLRHPEIVRKLVMAGVERANAMLGLSGSDKRCVTGEIVASLEALAPRLLPYVGDAGRIVSDALRRGGYVLLEGAQGALLDVDHGTYPFVTSSSTTAGGAATGAGIGPTRIDAVLGIVKAYTTRVGGGPLPTEAHDRAGERLRELGGEYGATTGRPRRCGWFDAMVVRYSARVNGLTGLAVTKLDVLDSFDEVPVCTGYRLGGEPLDELPDNVVDLERVEPVYEKLPGWKSATGAARRLSDLPAAARAYLDRLEQLAETPIRYVGVGTRREQLIET
ncbi:MAG TPA: adenylosuccinate synthase [Gemmatimonadales bacterium]|nr:adenylosuccinate synthase [Gemmatimonadales bacterium]